MAGPLDAEFPSCAVCGAQRPRRGAGAQGGGAPGSAEGGAVLKLGSWRSQRILRGLRSPRRCWCEDLFFVPAAITHRTIFIQELKEDS